MRGSSFLKSVARSGFCCLALSAGASFGAAVGNYVSHVQTGNQIDFTTGTTQKVRIYVCTPGIVRVSLDDRGTFTSTRDVLGMDDVNRTWDPVSSLTVTDATPGTTGSVVISTSELKVTVQKAPFRISYAKADGTALTADAAAMQSTGSSSGNPTFTFTQGTNEHYFGWGLAFEQFRMGYHQIDNKNQTYSFRRSTACYMYSTGGYGLWFLFAEPYPNASAWGEITNPTTGTGFDLRGTTAKYWMNPSTSPANGGLMEYASYFFIMGNWKEAMTGYTLVSGRPPRLGKKFYGIMRDMYFRSGTTVNTMRGWADMFRENRFNMDWVRMDNFFDWTNLGYLPTVPNSSCWNSSAEEAIQYYKQKGFYFGGMSAGWGFYGCCSAGCTQNELQSVSVCKTAVDHGFDWAWYDAMNYQSRKQAKEQWDTWVEAKGGDETKVMISRGWQALSSQAWPGNHMGDALNTESISAVFPSALLEHLVGYAWSHCDLGEGYDFGYMGFTLRPMVTIHMAGAAGGTATTFEECGNIGGYEADLKRVMRKWGNAHYRFIPYLFSYGMIAHETGIPVTRGMMCQNNGEQTPATYNLMYQAYVGEELIWSPYYMDLPGDEKTGIRHNIYLPSVPSGAWYDYFEGTKYAAPATINYTCDPGKGRDSLKLPVFVKAGSIIPLMDTLQYIGAMAESLITVQVWPTNGTEGEVTSGSFTLYEDEKPVKTSLSFSDNNQTVEGITVTIGAFAGSKYCPDPAIRKYRLEIHNMRPTITGISSDNTSLAAVSLENYNAGAPSYYWEAAKGGILYVNAPGNAATGFQVLINGGADVKRTKPGINARILGRNVRVSASAGFISVKVPFAMPHVVEVLSLQGKIVARRSARSATNHRVPLSGQGMKMYMIRVTTEGQTAFKKAVVL
jgi:alpha-glucosidase (family GH31 glycosyl hydrolase)